MYNDFLLLRNIAVVKGKAYYLHFLTTNYFLLRKFRFLKHAKKKSKCDKNWFKMRSEQLEPGDLDLKTSPLK